MMCFQKRSSDAPSEYARNRARHFLRVHHENTKDTKLEFDALSNRIIGYAIEVHKHLGPGLLESAYEKCMEYELQEAGIQYETQKAVPVKYKGMALDCGYRLDLVVEEHLILELKSVASIEDIYVAQLLTYMKLTGVKTGLILNFNNSCLQGRNAIRRLVL